MRAYLQRYAPAKHSTANGSESMCTRWRASASNCCGPETGRHMGDVALRLAEPEEPVWVKRTALIVSMIALVIGAFFVGRYTALLPQAQAAPVDPCAEINRSFDNLHRQTKSGDPMSYRPLFHLVGDHPACFTAKTVAMAKAALDTVPCRRRSPPSLEPAPRRAAQSPPAPPAGAPSRPPRRWPARRCPHRWASAGEMSRTRSAPGWPAPPPTPPAGSGSRARARTGPRAATTGRPALNARTGRTRRTQPGPIRTATARRPRRTACRGHWCRR